MLSEIGANGELAMLSRRKTYAGRIKHPGDPTEPATLDPLSAIAPLFRARPEIQDVCRFALQWEVVHEAEPAGFAQFHIVRGKSSTSELNTRVRFPSPAPALSTRPIAKGCAASSDLTKRTCAGCRHSRFDRRSYSAIPAAANSQHALDVGPGEIAANIQQRTVVFLRNFISKTVTKIQTGGM